MRQSTAEGSLRKRCIDEGLRWHFVGGAGLVRE